MAKAPVQEDALPAGLWNKIVYIMQHVDKLEKTGTNKEFGYKYVEEANVLAELRPLMVRVGLVLTHSVVEDSQVPRMSKGTPVPDVTRLKVQFTLVDADTGEKHEWYDVGYGQDTLDKGPYKALTGCMKYAVTKTFLMSTGDDPEQDVEGDRDRHSPEPQQRQQQRSQSRSSTQQPRSERRTMPATTDYDDEAGRPDDDGDPLQKPANLATMNKALALAANPLLPEAEMHKAKLYLAQPRTEGNVLSCIATLKKVIAEEERKIEEGVAGG